MKQPIHEVVIKINTPEGSGSGFYIAPDNGSLYVYIVTARHCLVGDNEVAYPKSALQVFFLKEGKWFIYQVQEKDVIRYGENNECEDMAVIVVERSNLPVSINFDQMPGLCMPPRGIAPTIIGLPKVTANELKRTLYQLTFLDDRDYQRQVQIQVDDPLAHEYNASILVEGYSGSPISITVSDKTWVSGLFLGYEEKTRRILGIDLTLLNDLLMMAEMPQLSIVAVETDVNIIAAVARVEENTQRVLTRVRQKIGTITLEREAIRTRIKELLNTTRLLIVTGKPGCGKSATVKAALGDLGASLSAIALQGEQLDRASLAEIFANEPFKIEGQFKHVLDSPAFAGKKVVLIDSIEKILETRHAETILDFFELLKKREDITLVLTCRSYAIEQLKIRFLQDFPAFPQLEVGVLNSEEISAVEQVYPHISQLLRNPAIARILKIPFNLNKAVSIIPASLSIHLGSEQDFARIMWEYVIEGRDKEPDPSIRKLRSEHFTKIALSRASKMIPYAAFPSADQRIIDMLASDEIIDKEPTLGQSFAAAHDIYEDWALKRFIQVTYLRLINGQGDYAGFYKELGTAPAVRRAFRLWCSEMIQLADSLVNDLVRQTISDITIEQYWKDELLVALMQSPYSKSFLQENADFLFDRRGQVLQRVVFLLQVACQEPDFSFIDRIEPAKKLNLYHNINLLPFGEGWASMINFLYSHRDKITLHFPLVLKVVMNWFKGIKNYGQLPEESRNAGLLILLYFKEFEQGYREDFDRRSNSGYIEDGILLLFRLTEVIKAELRPFIETAFRVETPSERHGLGNLRDKVIDLVLDGYESLYICKYFPDLVIEIAEKKWFFYMPSAEQLAQQQRDHPYFSYRSSIHQEYEFGLSSYTGMHYFPPSPWNTPILNLLYLAPKKTVEFLVKFFNHVADAYVNSDFGKGSEFLPLNEERSSITLKFADGFEKRQHASMAMWAMYRGTYLATPNLLESALMALEQYLLEIADLINSTSNTKDKVRFQSGWDYCFDTFLRESNSVMTTAVLLSVAQANKELAGAKILPVLAVREIYLWDIIRLSKESSALSPVGSHKNAFVRQRAMHTFQQLPHRKRNARELLINLSLHDLAPQIFAILDKFYMIDPQDADWQITVGSMDRRNWKVTAELENGVVVEPELEAPLQQKVEESKREMEETNEVSSATHWCMKKLHKEAVEDDSFEMWKKNFDRIKKGIALGTLKRIHTQPGLIAGIGITDFYEQLNEAEREWCVAQVFEIIRYEIFDAHKERDFMHIQHTSFEMDAAYGAITRVMHHATSGQKGDLKRSIFVSFLRLQEKSCKDALIASIHSHLWQADPAFALNLIKALIVYAGISRVLMHHQHFANQPKEPNNSSTNVFAQAWTWIKGRLFKNGRQRIRRKAQFNSQVLHAKQVFDKLVLKIGTGGVHLDMQQLVLDTQSTFGLFEVLRLIPWNTEIGELRSYYIHLLRFILANLEDDNERWSVNERFHHDLLRTFQKQFAGYVLTQPQEVAHTAFKELTDWVYEPDYQKRFRDRNYDFVAGCLDHMMDRVIRDESRSENFWQLWSHLIEKNMETTKHPFADKLLLNYFMFASDLRDWVPLRGKKELYRRYISTGVDLESSAKLLSGIGFKEMMPDGILLLAERKLAAPEDGDRDHKPYYFEKVVIQCYYDSAIRKSLKESPLLRKAFIHLLDQLIEHTASSSAYIIRDDFISIGKS